jgi:hypothetical protein
MTRSRILLRASGALVLAAGLAAGCGDDTNTVSQAEVEQQAAAELAAAVGADEPNISCPGDLEAEVGATMECDLSVEGDDAVYPVYVEVTSVEGDTANFSVEVGDQPKE